STKSGNGASIPISAGFLRANATNELNATNVIQDGTTGFVPEPANPSHVASASINERGAGHGCCSEEEDHARTQSGPGARRRRAEVRGRLRSQQDRPLGPRGEEGCQEGRQLAQAGREASRPLTARFVGVPRVAAGVLRSCRRSG